MKIAKIKYRIFGEGRVQVTGWNNVASIKDITDTHGRDTARIYMTLFPKFYTLQNKPNLLVIYTEDKHRYELRLGQIISTVEFRNYIRWMKQAGEHLTNAIKGIGEEKEIEI